MALETNSVASRNLNKRARGGVCPRVPRKLQSSREGFSHVKLETDQTYREDQIGSPKDFSSKNYKPLKQNLQSFHNPKSILLVWAAGTLLECNYR